MFFNRRKKYNGKVTALLPVFGFDLEEAGMMKTLNALDIAWSQKYNEYEGALFISYLVLFGYHQKGHEKENKLLESIRFIENEWVQKGIVSPKLVEQFRAKLENYCSSEEKSTQKNQTFEFLPNMPDIMSKQPIKVFACGDHMAVVVEHVETIAKNRYKQNSPLHYHYALALISSSTNQPMLIVTLETGITADYFLGIFTETGERFNLGRVDDVSLDFFLNVALNKVSDKLGISTDSIMSVS
uniref:Uncharacterized protein n=1 Tax=Vibrio alginolyticus TaxID=663 RepID=A0A1P8DPQ3_VIBAL|nr:hypothetical protein [Vibrio alginolyticus]APU91102.1 hypothetical protein [Vibrio alginolyticus]